MSIKDMVLEIFSEKELQHEFPIVKKYLYFASASTGIIPEMSLRAQERFMDRYRDSDLFHDPETFEMMARLRKNIAGLIGAREGEIALMANTSLGLNTIAAAFPWEDGDEILIGDREFPANSYPWSNQRPEAKPRGKSAGVIVKWLHMRGGRLSCDEIVNSVTPNTKALAISAVQFSDGFRCDLSEIVRFCNNRNIFVFVDGIQAAGALEIDATETGFDAFAAGGQKHLLSPYGTGFLQVTPNLLNLLRPAFSGWLSHFVSPEDFLDLLKHYLPPAPDARRLEIGSMAYCALWGMDSSVKMLLDIGIEKIEKHNIALTDYFCSEVEKVAGVEIVSDRNDKHKSHVVSIRVPRGRSVWERLAAEKIVVSFRESCLRFAFHIFNTEEQIDRVTKILNRIIV